MNIHVCNVKDKIQEIEGKEEERPGEEWKGKGRKENENKWGKEEKERGEEREGEERSRGQIVIYVQRF